MADNVGNFSSSTSGIPAVKGDASNSNGVNGLTSSDGDSAIYGAHEGQGIGIFGRGGKKGGVNAHGIFGQVDNVSNSVASGVYGKNEGLGTGVTGEAVSGHGVSGLSANGVGLYGQGGQNAGFFEGDVKVTGNLSVDLDIILTGGAADCAEEFDILRMEGVEPGTVMVIDQNGALQQSQRAYDKRVAGIITGAGDYKPGIILDRQESRDNRLPIALVGKVYCKVDARYSPIEVGDMLTTSPTPGHAMKADDPLKAFGAVIGKALYPFQSGQGLIPILVSLQ